MEFDIYAPPEEAFERRLIVFGEQRHHDFTITCLSAILDQRDVAITNVLVDHRIAFHFQRINSLGTNASQEKARYGDRFLIVDYFDRSAGGNSSQQPHFTKGIGIVNLDRERKRAFLILAFQQTTPLQSSDVFGDRCSRLDAEVSRNLSVGRLVRVPLEEKRDVIQNFFLTLSAWEHKLQHSRCYCLMPA